MAGPVRAMAGGALAFVIGIAKNASMPDMDRGLLYGEACFETLRVIDGAMFDWPAHEARLQRGLAAFGLPLPGGLRERCLAEAGRSGRDAIVRLTVTGGVAPWGLKPARPASPGVYLQARPFTPLPHPLRLVSLAWPFPFRQKIAKFTADYADTLRAMQMAQSPSEMDIIICSEIDVYSGAYANIFMYRCSDWWTPESGVGVLPGVVRQAIVGEGGARECACPVSWLDDCAAIALSNSGGFILPVGEVNGRALAVNSSVYAPLIAPLLGKPGVPEALPCVA
ncbi:MAG: aminotransferase class IV [Mariprofundaceae bacterium]